MIFSTLNAAVASSNSSVLAAATRTWVVNLVQYCPVVLPYDYPVERVFWMNGSTLTSTNIQFGIYTEDGRRIYATPTTAMNSTLGIQFVTPATKFVLPAGRYYFAWTCNNTTNRGYTYTAGVVNLNVLCGMLEETTGIFGLPATMTPVRYARAWGPCLCGITRRSTGFT
jgi:hypothetical protein